MSELDVALSGAREIRAELPRRARMGFRAAVMSGVCLPVVYGWELAPGALRVAAASALMMWRLGGAGARGNVGGR